MQEKAPRMIAVIKNKSYWQRLKTFDWIRPAESSQ